MPLLPFLILQCAVPPPFPPPQAGAGRGGLLRGSILHEGRRIIRARKTHPPSLLYTNTRAPARGSEPEEVNPSSREPGGKRADVLDPDPYHVAAFEEFPARGAPHRPRAGGG